jgi:hypothetical protein
MDEWKDGEMHAGLHASVDGLYGKRSRQMNKDIYIHIYMHYMYIYIHTHMYVHLESFEMWC